MGSVALPRRCAPPPGPCQVPLSEEELAEQSAARPERAAIGGEGGFQLDAKDYRVEVEEVCGGRDGWESMHFASSPGLRESGLQGPAGKWLASVHTPTAPGRLHLDNERLGGLLAGWGSLHGSFCGPNRCRTGPAALVPHSRSLLPPLGRLRLWWRCRRASAWPCPALPCPSWCWAASRRCKSTTAPPTRQAGASGVVVSAGGCRGCSRLVS